MTARPHRKPATSSPALSPEARVSYRVGELANATGLSESTIWRRIADGSIPSVKRFGARLIPAEAVRAMFEGRS